ncbi:hypothetical protein SODALDRAFT_376440 [Sodiomyces alkalinus F11]|uniref:Rhodopsin domain-containing protein n=1 Tax=Sodiomyces alkalinus (strain CBS 110278 / VKM F-3762 / F11) TaxID=1314773 RepID=A0A3N2Q1V7_SODAK|nr:hypothetical protein SODALDRAFT_376440 [Sodiomyces alkalinus F11]ROT40668.1 hypothetical protein SODALDRAFT_376440 [Sodiomyces alkalinus F11]
MLYSDPPPLRDAAQDKPSLLVCWWITIFCTVIILLRVTGRFIRSEKLFREDRIASLALIPMYLRMGCVHFILHHGTNNAQLEGVNLTALALERKTIASGLVLASRIFYAATLWILKETILEYFRRLTESASERYAARAHMFIRCALGVTFVAILISTLAECQPFHGYWQVLPDPGGQCRQAYAQLITFAVCNVLTDLMLVFFPIPMILQSALGTKKKVQLTLLFSLSLVVVGITLFRVPHIIQEHGSQQMRSLLASVELLFATTAANSLVLGSFVRDRGVKKGKFRYGSVAANSIDRTLTSRRPIAQRHWGSDVDLVRDIGVGLHPELRHTLEAEHDDGQFPKFMPAPLAKRFGDDLKHWHSPRFSKGHGESSERSDDSLLQRERSLASRSNSTATPHRVSFFDVGGLLEEQDQSSSSKYRHDSNVSNVDPLSPAKPASSSGQRRGSTAVLQDINGMLSPTSSSTARQDRKNPTEMQPLPHGHHTNRPVYDQMSADAPELIDAGGLLK